MKRLILEFWSKLKIRLQRDAGIKDARLLLGMVIGMFVVVLMTTLNARISELKRMETHRAELAAEVAQLLETREALQTQVVYAGSDAAVADWARGEGHMKQEGDHIVVPVPEEGAAPAAAAIREPTPPPPTPWEVWQALFFEK
ncbi:MAG: hypothetical protein RBT34_01185 [Anaerolineaceae bacterium]|jgi:outer membrane murein-binding lipoprotein Lpp|nr:hypothetical protein [Anaerolineaceae bacterium]